METKVYIIFKKLSLVYLTTLLFMGHNLWDHFMGVNNAS